MMTQVLHEVKVLLDQGDAVDLSILLDRIAEVFHVDEVEMETEDTSLQAAMMASATSGGSRPRKPETQDRADTGRYQDRAGAGGYQGRTAAGGGSGQTWKQKRTEQTPADDDVQARTLKALNDIKSDMGIVKKFLGLTEQGLRTADTQPRQKRPGPGWRSAEQDDQPTRKSVNFAGAARVTKGARTKTSGPKPLTNRTVTLSDSDSDGQECAAMAMVNSIPDGKRTSYRIMGALPGTALQPGFWKQRPADSQHSEGELQPSRPDMMAIEISSDGESPPVPNQSTTITPKDPYGKPLSYEAELLEYGQLTDMVTTTAEQSDDRSRARATVFDPDSGNWYVPGEDGVLRPLYTPTDVSLGNVPFPGYANYIAPELKKTAEPTMTRSKTRASKFVLPSSFEPPSSDDDADPNDCDNDAPSADDVSSPPVVRRKVLATSARARTSSNPKHPANRSVRVSPCIPSLAGAKLLHGTSGAVPFGYHPGDM